MQRSKIEGAARAIRAKYQSLLPKKKTAAAAAARATTDVGTGFVSLQQPAITTEYFFWRDPNVLIERLALLLASKRSGNTSHDGEIANIEGELRRVGIIL